MEPALRVQPHGEREEHVLLLEDPGRKGLGRVVVEDRDGLLQDDGATVDALVHEVDRAPAHLRPPRDRVRLGMGPGERGEEGGMDVQDAIRELADEGARDEPHEPREHDEVDAAVPEDLDRPSLPPLPVLAEGLVVVEPIARAGLLKHLP